MDLIYISNEETFIAVLKKHSVLVSLILGLNVSNERLEKTTEFEMSMSLFQGENLTS